MSHKHPWFKFWADSYLSDPAVDDLSLEAQGLYVRMLCVCNQRGNIPADPEEIARLTRCKPQSVLQCHSQCKPLFKLQGELLFSEAMEADKAKSEAARANAEKRYSKGTYQQEPANGIASDPANRTAKKVRKIEREKREGETEEDAHGAESPPTPHEPVLVDSEQPAQHEQNEQDFNSQAGFPSGLTYQREYATHLLDAIGVPPSNSLRKMVGSAIGFVARDEVCTTETAAVRLLDRMRGAQARGETRWYFWLEDGKWKSAKHQLV
jgi:uncharacterized protein YdaU (DUF1376 family)